MKFISHFELSTDATCIDETKNILYKVYILGT